MDGSKERVKQERVELIKKTESLGRFLGSEKYRSLTNEMQFWLCEQYRVMNEYERILTTRLAIWDGHSLSRYVPTAYCPKCRKVFADGEGLCDCGVSILTLPKYPCLRIDIEEG